MDISKILRGPSAPKSILILGKEHEAYVPYDTDGDGFIDRSEFNDVPLLTLYDAWDHDHDGMISDSDWTRVTAQFYDAE